MCDEEDLHLLLQQGFDDLPRNFRAFSLVSDISVALRLTNCGKPCYWTLVQYSRTISPGKQLRTRAQPWKKTISQHWTDGEPSRRSMSSWKSLLSHPDKKNGFTLPTKPNEIQRNPRLAR